MYVVDSVNGAILQTIALSGGNLDSVSALTGDPGQAVLLGVKTNRSVSPTTNSLAAIDPTTGATTVRGSLPGDMDALAVDITALPAVPTLGEWGQLLMVGVLIATAVWMIRRRHPASA